MVDNLPVSLEADPVSLLTYRIQIFNDSGHSAGESAVSAYAAAGAAPIGVASFRAHASEQGAVLEWQALETPSSDSVSAIDLTRVYLQSSAITKEKRPIEATVRLPGKPRAVHPTKAASQLPGTVHLRAPDASTISQRQTAGTLDSTAVMGDTYSYTAVRVRSVSIRGRQLEIQSAPSATVTLSMKDTFPPKIPTGLATIAGRTAPRGVNSGNASVGPYIDLSWEPNAEADLAGYRVYRQLAAPDGASLGPLDRLTALPICTPAYRDVAVVAGQGYIYSVTAVDSAGNESAPSARALEVSSPNAGGPSH